MSFKLIITLFSLFSQFAHSKTNYQMILKNSGPNWQLSDQRRSEFNDFLYKRLEDLKKNAPLLQSPNNFYTDSKEEFFDLFKKYIMTDYSAYMNRMSSCKFLQRVRENLKDSHLLHFNTLTQQGKVCLATDLNILNRKGWTRQMVSFFWTRPWIPQGENQLNLKDYIYSTLNINDIPEPEFVLMQIEFDGYAAGLSKTDQSYVLKHSNLKKVYELFSKANFNHPETYPQIHIKIDGEPLDKVTSSYIRTFYFKPVILLSDYWSPMDMIDLIVHEFAHIYHIEHRNIYSTNSEGIPTIYSDSVHNEGFAEVFTWNVMKNLYATYPETEFFHLFKLLLMTNFKPKKNDPHYIGAAGLFNHLHSDNNDVSLIQSLAETRDFSGFLLNLEDDSLNFYEQNNIKVIELNWGSDFDKMIDKILPQFIATKTEK